MRKRLFLFSAAALALSVSVAKPAAASSRFDCSSACTSSIDCTGNCNICHHGESGDNSCTG